MTYFYSFTGGWRYCVYHWYKWCGSKLQEQWTGACTVPPISLRLWANITFCDISRHRVRYLRFAINNGRGLQPRYSTGHSLIYIHGKIQIFKWSGLWDIRKLYILWHFVTSRLVLALHARGWPRPPASAWHGPWYDLSTCQNSAV